MKKLFAAALLATTMAGFGAANAAPLAPLGSVAGITMNDDVIAVAQGCGPRMSRDARGRCRPDFRRPPPPRRYVPPHHRGHRR
jgi:hypothetical protein